MAPFDRCEPGLSQRGQVVGLQVRQVARQRRVPARDGFVCIVGTILARLAPIPTPLRRLREQPSGASETAAAETV